MRKALNAAAVVAAAVLMVGCIETKQDYTLNPDGSGKVLVEMTMHQMPFALGPPDQQGDPDLTAKQFVKGILDGSTGVDAWSDVTYAKTEDGRTTFIGTAYFKDYSALKFQWLALLFTLTKDDMGGMVLSLRQNIGDKPATPPPDLSEEDIADLIEGRRKDYQQMRPMVASVYGTMKLDVSFHLPGTRAEVSGFKKEPSGAVRLTLDGARLLKAVDELMADDAHMRHNVLLGYKPMSPADHQMDEWTSEKLFGAKGPIRARVTGPFKPLFAYESEVKAAKAAYAKMIQRLGLDKLPAAPPTPTLPPGLGLPGGQPKGRQGPSY